MKNKTYTSCVPCAQLKNRTLPLPLKPPMCSFPTAFPSFPLTRCNQYLKLHSYSLRFLSYIQSKKMKQSCACFSVTLLLVFSIV